MDKPDANGKLSGLTNDEVTLSRAKFGLNNLHYRKKRKLFSTIMALFTEPMIILLLVASCIYFLTGNISDGIFLSFSILLVAAISLYQDSRSKNALEKLSTFIRPAANVIRNGETQQIPSGEIVVGDLLLVNEGMSVLADGRIIQAHDLSIDESILTGESFPVLKNEISDDATISAGTTVVSGSAIVIVDAIGNKTRIGKIGKSIDEIQETKTPLELQINHFVRIMVVIGAAIFIVVWGINYFQSYNVMDSLLKALTLAMSILPEEIPVAFTTFMAVGSWRLMRLGVVLKQMKTVETLGSATTICTDKTGTLTQNRMSLTRLFVWPENRISNEQHFVLPEEQNLIRIAMWASEPNPFDPMEVALHEAYHRTSKMDEQLDYQLVHEYPLSGKPPMMTHVFENSSGYRVIAAKGAPEALLEVSQLSDQEKETILKAMHELASNGFRVLGIGQASSDKESYPETQQQLRFTFKGLVAFYDPPKENIAAVLQDLYKAGVSVKIITGDNAVTTTAIAAQIGLKGADNSIDGASLMMLPDSELQKVVFEKQVFTRMFPEAKLKVVNALKIHNEIVAMIGDGVNDGPALKAAHIGVAMGSKGTEIAKDAASLIILNDDLANMVTAIAMGRKIYSNLKKALRYIISIHIPIILVVFIPLAFHWAYPNIFSPVHVIFFELIMGPTCSIIFENEPIEANIMMQPPRQYSRSFFTFSELMTSVIQGLIITLGCLFMYRYAVHYNYSEQLTRALVFLTLIISNILLTFVNRSFHYTVLTTLFYRNKLVPLIVLLTIAITSLLLLVPSFVDFFGFESINQSQALLCIMTAICAVLWIEPLKRMLAKECH